MSINFRKETQEDRLVRLEYEKSLVIQPELAFDGLALRSYQKDLAQSSSKFRVAHWGRRTGKSTLAAAIATYELASNRSVLVVNPYIHNTTYILDMLGATACNNNFSSLTYNNPNHAASVCGLAPHTIILDEYMYIDSSIMEHIQAMMTCHSDTKLVALSSMSGAPDYLEDIQKLDSCYVSSIPTTHPEVGIDMTPILAAVPADVAEQEYLGY